MKNTKIIILFYAVIFVLLYGVTLNFNYVEGDDAMTILYHLCGRNPQIQMPYAPYNSGLDFLLRFSGLHGEASLRTFAVLISFLSGFVILVLYVVFLETFFEGSQLVNPKKRFWLYLMLPFIIPDTIFHSLIINSTNISFAFLLGSLIQFVKFLKTNRNAFLFASVLLFAIAVPLRWTMLTALPLYTGLFLYFNPIGSYTKETILQFLKIAAANIVAVILALLLIYVTGYSPIDIRNTIVSGTSYLENSETSVLSVVATASAFLTPALLFLLLFGTIRIFEISRTKRTILISVLAFAFLSISPFVLLGFFPLYKFLIPLLPVILALAVFGFDFIAKRKLLLVVFVFAVAGPWLVGIRIDAGGTFCGPGFELNTSKRTPGKPENSTGSNPDNRVKIEKVSPAFGSGFYLPMSEGPRPLYGYGYVLFGGGWKNQIDKITLERKKIYEFLMQHQNAEYFQDRRSAYFECDLYRYGFATQMNFSDGKPISERKFIRRDASLTIHVVPNGVSKTAWIADYMKTAKNPVIYWSSYSSDILKLYSDPANNIEIIGPFAVLKKD